MNPFKDIFRYLAKSEQKILPSSETSKPPEYNTIICDHIWKDPIILYLSSRISSDDYNQFLDSIKYKEHTDYNDIIILKFRYCSNCKQVEVKSDYENLYGPINWTQ